MNHTPCWGQRYTLNPTMKKKQQTNPTKKSKMNTTNPRDEIRNILKEILDIMEAFDFGDLEFDEAFEKLNELEERAEKLEIPKGAKERLMKIIDEAKEIIEEKWEEALDEALDCETEEEVEEEE